MTPRSAGQARGPAHARRLPAAVVVTALIGTGTGLMLVLNTASAANEVSRHDLAAKDGAVSAQVQEARDEVAAKAAPAALALAAVELGMVPAGNPAFLIVSGNGTVHIRGKAEAALPAPVALPTVAATHVRHQPAHRAAHRSSTAHPGTARSTAHGRTTAAAAAHPTTTHHASHGASSTKPSPTPTRPHPTPTPVVTIPGGPR